jgi:hypothetical protein
MELQILRSSFLLHSLNRKAKIQEYSMTVKGESSLGHLSFF